MKTTAHNRLKHLQVERTQVQRAIEEEGVTPGRKRKLKKLTRQIRKLEKSRKVIVSEHALLRYLERVRGIDLEAVKAEMLTPKAEQLIMTFGSCAMTVSNHLGSFNIKVRNRVITTIIGTREAV